MRAVVDIQLFPVNEKMFIAKELAIYDGNKISHYIFKPPFSFENLSRDTQKQVTWLTYNHHGIKWEEGYTPVFQFKQIIKQLTKNAEIIYVKGRGKADFLKKYIAKPIAELNEKPALMLQEPSCFYHSTSPCMCALSNAITLYNNFVRQ